MFCTIEVRQLFGFLFYFRRIFFKCVLFMKKIKCEIKMVMYNKVEYFFQLKCLNFVFAFSRAFHSFSPCDLVSWVKLN